MGQHQCGRRHHQRSRSHWESTGVKVQSRFNGSTFCCDTEGQRHTLHEQITFREIWIPISHAKHCIIMIGGSEELEGDQYHVLVSRISRISKVYDLGSRTWSRNATFRDE